MHWTCTMFVEISIWRQPVFTVWDIRVDKRGDRMWKMRFKWNALQVSFGLFEIKYACWCSKLDWGRIIQEDRYYKWNCMKLSVRTSEIASDPWFEVSSFAIACSAVVFHDLSFFVMFKCALWWTVFTWTIFKFIFTVRTNLFQWHVFHMSVYNSQVLFQLVPTICQTQTQSLAILQCPWKLRWVEWLIPNHWTWTVSPTAQTTGSICQPWHSGPSDENFW